MPPCTTLARDNKCGISHSSLALYFRMYHEPYIMDLEHIITCNQMATVNIYVDGIQRQ